MPGRTAPGVFHVHTHAFTYFAMGVLKLTALEAGVLAPREFEAVTVAVYCVAAVSPATWQLGAWHVVVTAEPP